MPTMALLGKLTAVCKLHSHHRIYNYMQLTHELSVAKFVYGARGV